jgi:hypothetical protein
MTDPDQTALLPANVFMHLIVSFLTPMFLATTGGNIEQARVAAIGTINAYALSTQDDLLSVAQVIALGLASLDSLTRSMADDLPVTLVLRLRGNAASLMRAADRSRRRLQAPILPAAAPSAPTPHTPEPDPESERRKDQAVLADIAAVRQRLAVISATRHPAATQAATVKNPTPRPPPFKHGNNARPAPEPLPAQR